MTDGFIPQEPPEDWNGRFSLLEDIDRWFVVAHCVDHAKPLIACTPTREEAIGAGRRIAGELLAKRIPERIWTASGYSFARELKKQGAWYDPLFHSWYFPDEKRALANPGMVCAALRKAQSLRAAYVSELVRSSSPARWIELDVPFKDKERVRAAGAVWNGRSRKWLVSSVGPLKEFADWLPKKWKGKAGDTGVPGVLQYPVLLRVPYEREIIANFWGALREDVEAAAGKIVKNFYAPTGSACETFEEFLTVPTLESPRQAVWKMLLEAGFDKKRPENQQYVLFADGQKHKFFVDGDGASPSGQYIVRIDKMPFGIVKNFRTRTGSKWSYSACRGVDWNSVFGIHSIPF